MVDIVKAALRFPVHVVRAAKYKLKSYVFYRWILNSRGFHKGLKGEHFGFHEIT